MIEPGMPRWVKVFIALGVLVVLVMALLHLGGAGFPVHHLGY